MTKPRVFRVAHLVIFCGMATSTLAQTTARQQFNLQFRPSTTTIAYTLDASLHTVHGTFQLNSGEIQYDPTTGAIHGTITINATSGQSGNESRDHKMHKDVLESARYPEIVFRPDRVEGKLNPGETSTLQVHGMFSVHGTDHEITLPIQVQITGAAWKADTVFTIPYVSWGMKNPSNFFLHVKPEVELKVHASGSL